MTQRRRREVVYLVCAGFRWPDDIEGIQRYVAVDWAADPRKLATRPAQEFDAVKPLGPHFTFHDYPEELLDALRQGKESVEPADATGSQPADDMGRWHERHKEPAASGQRVNNASDRRHPI